MFQLVVTKPAGEFIAFPGLQEFEDIPGPDEFYGFPGQCGAANLSLYFESGVSYKHANVTLMLVSCLHALWFGARLSRG